MVPDPERALVVSAIDAEARLLHRRLGHLSTGSLQRLEAVTIGLQGPVKALKEPCEPCILVKTVRVVNREGPERVITPLARLHTDFWGPYSVPSLYGSLYFVSFIDEATRKTWVFFSRDRASIRTIFIELKARVELETGLKIQAIRCDNAPEYKALAEYFRPFGLKFEFITPYFH
jgi:Integrase core domain/GAG-pre-integrase domain